MTDNSMLTPAGGPASRPGPPGPALLCAVLIVAGSVVVGLAGGAIWAAAAPRVLYQVSSLSPPTAFVTNSETSAFIAADGWYCFVGVAGGALIGLVGYLFGVRRYGPVPMAGIVVGSVGASFIAAWVGHQLSGAPGFDHLLATSRLGTYLHAPISLGSQGALGFWPLAAGGVAGGIELLGVLKARRRAAYVDVPMPGMEKFGSRPFPERPYPGPNSASQGSQGAAGQGGARRRQGGADPGEAGQDGASQPHIPRGQDLRRAPGAADPREGGSGRVAP